MSITIHNPTAQDVKDLLTSGKKISGFQGLFEIDASKLDIEIDGSEDIAKGLIAPGHKAKLRDFCEHKTSKDGKKCVVTLKWGLNPDALESMVKSHGIDSIKLNEDITWSNYTGLVEEKADKITSNTTEENTKTTDGNGKEVYTNIPKKEFLESLTKAELKSWYDEEKITVSGIDWGKTKAVNLALIKSYYGYV